MEELIDLEVEPGEAAPEGVALRFKAVSAPRAVHRIRMALSGEPPRWWTVARVDEEGGEAVGPAEARDVEDSSDGTARLYAGGAQGLLLVDEVTGERRREPYLLLALATEDA
jgi:hypothetical protein